MELLKIQIDGDELANVPFTAVYPDTIGKEACWQNGELEIFGSLTNETLSLHVRFKQEKLLVFGGAIAAQATFIQQLADGRTLTLFFQ